MEQRELRNTPLLYVYSRADEKISPLDRQGITQLLFFLIGQGFSHQKSTNPPPSAAALIKP
jgi:hypothetical protein